ncbi:protein BCCIP homolog [Prorops nasuta]|uniref:protein BCCIP homolog n=1 Tax=Prorops nasuta TaxID=863751 RepID=UPI0034CD2448
MAAPVKKRDFEKRSKELDNDGDGSSSSNEDDSQDVINEQGMEIQVDFEGRNPQDPDFHGIKTLLTQLFLKAHVDLGSLTDLIITQNYVGSVVKQSEDLEESDDEESNANDVFGITTVVNISDRQNVPCIQQLRELLKQLASEHATDQANAMVKNLLENDSAPLGLLINERFVNIPPQISVPLLENLISEMRRSCSKKMPFDFAYYVLICKLYKIDETKTQTKKSKQKNTEDPNIIWSNPEEEIFAEEASVSFEFSVQKESDSGLSGQWNESDSEMIPFRRVIIFEASKLLSIISKIKSQLS